MSNLANLPRLSAQDNQAIRQALDNFRHPEAETLELLQILAESLRPDRYWDEAEICLRHEAMLAALEADPALLLAFRRHFVRFLASRRLVTFFTDSGILPGTGFFSEWWRIIWQHLLPEVQDERRLKDCIHLIYDRRVDWLWLERIPSPIVVRFWHLAAPGEELNSTDWGHIREELLSAVLLLAHRVSGLGVEAELMRATPDFEDYAPRFIALSTEALDLTHSIRAHVADPAQPPDNGEHLLVIVDQCVDALQRIRKRALTVGTSLHLTYVLTRSEQSLARLTELVAVLAADLKIPTKDAPPDAWKNFAWEAFLAETRRNSLPRYLGQALDLLALRVTDNAARSGEHYISESRAEYRDLLSSAMGAGVIVACMAFIKIAIAGLELPLFGRAFLNSLDYGLGFVLIYLLGFTIATKQPAMTAQTLAAHLSGLNLNKSADLERLTDLVAAVSRSQLAAILGNVCVAFPVALLVGLGLTALTGMPAVAANKAATLIEDLSPLGWAIPHAAIAGFYLYLAGLISGYFDNLAAYNQVGTRVARLRWLNRLLGPERAGKVGAYLGDHLGGLTGNFLFGCMLGSTGIIGIILGLPLDIRHIAFASANLAYGLAGLDFKLSWETVVLSALGVAAIGFTNLTVSFSLALRTALGARRLGIGRMGRILGALGRRLKAEPRSFLLPPKN